MTKMRGISIVMGCCIAFGSWAQTEVTPSVITRAELFKVVSGLGFILVFILVLSWLAKRIQRSHKGTHKGFSMVANMVIGPREKITLIQAGDRYLLLGIGSGTVSLLHDYGENKPTGFVVEHTTDFTQILKSALGKKSA